MKHVFTSLVFLWATLSFSQSNEVSGQPTHSIMKISGLSMSITVDSAKEVESTFNIKDIREIFDDTDEGENISFEIICNGDKMSNNVNSKLSYKVNGNTNDFDAFIQSVEKIKNAAVNYYKNKQ